MTHRRLKYPELDGDLVAQLALLAHDLDDLHRHDPAKRAEFNALAGTSLEDPLAFHFSGACDAEEFVRDLLAQRHVGEFAGLTDDELLEQIRSIIACEQPDEISFWLRVLELNLGGAPVGDLIFWPAQALERLGISDTPPDALTPEAILRICRSIPPRVPIPLPESSLLRPESIEEARALLAELGAPPRLVRHVELVDEAAELLLEGLTRLGVHADAAFVRVGVALHDAGKIRHPAELDGPGAAHEPDGEAVLLEHGVSARVARVCLSHARWANMPISFEELLIALADKLWKGVRKPELEELVIDGVATRLGKDRWDVFVDLDSLFERIAADGTERLERSRQV